MSYNRLNLIKPSFFKIKSSYLRPSLHKSSIKIQKFSLHQNKISLSLLIIFLCTPVILLANKSSRNDLLELYRIGKYSYVISYYEGLSKKNQLSVDPDLVLLTAKAYIENKNFELAKEKLRIIINGKNYTNSQVEEAKLLLVKLHITLGDLGKARYILKEDFSNSDWRTSCPLYQFVFALIKSKENSLEAGSIYCRLISSLTFDNYLFVDVYISYIQYLIKNNQDSLARSQLDLLIQKTRIGSFENLAKTALIDLTDGYLCLLEGKISLSIEIYNNLESNLMNFNSGWSSYYIAETYRLRSFSYRALGHYRKSIQHDKKYIELAKNYHNPNYFRFAEIYTSISINYKLLGHYEISNGYLNQAIDIHKIQNSENSLINARIRKAINLFEQQKYFESRKLFSYIIQNTPESASYSIFLISAYFHRAKIHVHNENYERAIADIRNCINKQKVFFGNNPEILISTYNIFLDILNKKTDFEFDEKVFPINKILKQSNQTKSFKNLRYIHFFNNLSSFLVKSNALDSAEIYLSKIIESNNNYLSQSDLNENPELTLALANSKYIQGLAYKKKYSTDSVKENLNRSNNALKTSLKLSKAINRTYKSLADRISFYENQQKIYSQLIQNLLDEFVLNNGMPILGKAFRLNQQVKAAQLLETLNRNLAFQQTNIPDSLTIQVNSLKEQASYLSTQIYKLENKEMLLESDSSRLSDFKSVLLDNQVLFNDLMLYLEQNFPKYYEINYNPKIATIQDMQQRLLANEALIEYFVGSEHIYAFTISQDTATVHQLAKVPDSSISRFRDIIIPKGLGQNMNATFRQFVYQSHQLYQQLLTKPLESIKKSQSSINKLYIIPDKSLNYLAFDLLLSAEVEKDRFVGYRKLPYLIKDYNVSYGYSASILFREGTTRNKAPFNGKVLAFAPSYEQLLADKSKLNDLGEFRNSLSPLKHNKSEVDGISNYFEVRVYKAIEATERKFVESFQGNDVLHLAMHGLVDSKDSEKSRLVFTNVEDSIHDNYLHNFELYNLNINAKLAVLSACNTGYGKLEGGEGVMSIARAFTYAGTESVVMSQWPADDEASSVIMQSFYQYLADGKRKDDALRLAKLDYLQQAATPKRNPFYWNNFVVMGDVSPLVKDNTRIYVYIVLSFIGLLLLFAIAFRFLAKRRTVVS